MYKLHEFSITQQIVKCILKEAKRHNAKKITEVNLAIGKFTALGIEQIQFCYELLVKGSIMENSKLRIEEVKPVGKCEKCGYKGPIKEADSDMYHFMLPSLKCTKCGGTVSIIKGRECMVKSFRMVADNVPVQKQRTG